MFVPTPKQGGIGPFKADLNVGGIIHGIEKGASG